ncbi:MAG: endopeptidase La, partial [Halobacteriovoraceae bacterium]|nr:endopeptidase La [Halobacteriovoraceae bacterium]
MVTNYEGENIEFKEVLPLLPIRDIVVYPFMILPLYVGRESSIQAVEEAINNTDRLILLASQKDIQAEAPSPNEIYSLGTVAMIMRKRNLPDGRLKILIQGLTKARIIKYQESKSFFQVEVEKVETVDVSEKQEVIEALLRTVRTNLENVISKNKVLSPDILMILEDIHNPSRFADLVS